MSRQGGREEAERRFGGDTKQDTTPRQWTLADIVASAAQRGKARGDAHFHGNASAQRALTEYAKLLHTRKRERAANGARQWQLEHLLDNADARSEAHVDARLGNTTARAALDSLDAAISGLEQSVEEE